MKTEALSVKEYLASPNRNSFGEGTIKLPFTDIELSPGSLTFIAGRPGMGRTTYLLEIIKHNSEKKCLGFFPRIRSERVKGLTELPLFINSLYTQDASELESAVIEGLKQVKPDYLIVDSLEQTAYPAEYWEDRKKDYDLLIEMLNRIALEQNLPVICVGIFGDMVDFRGGAKRPMLCDLNSYAAQIIPSLVLGLYRDGYYQAERFGDNPDESSLITLKSSYGEFKEYEFTFNGNIPCFHPSQRSPK